MTKTFTIIKRIEYENIREIRPTLQKDFNNPDKEKISKAGDDQSSSSCGRTESSAPTGYVRK